MVGFARLLRALGRRVESISTVGAERGLTEIMGRVTRREVPERQAHLY